MAVEAPSMVTDRELIRWYAKVLRHWATPRSALELTRRFYTTDLRAVLPTIQVPTLILAREDDDPDELAYTTGLIPTATQVTLPGRDSLTFAGDQDSLVGALRAFLEVERAPLETSTVLRTILFTDIVGSTGTTASLGDRAWKELLERHHRVVRAELARFEGTEVDTAGDGFFATFEGPGRAIRCALAIADAVRSLGIEIRAGVHAGECEIVEGKVAGLAVSIASRIGGLGQPSEVLVSQTVRDLVAGSRVDLDDRGMHELKGVPGEWRLFAAVLAQPL
jgi:class 3 adenylate cyclase